MPAFNEGRNALEFVRELCQHPSFRKNDAVIILDDCSSDLTGQMLAEWAKAHLAPVSVYVNEQNIGHGPSTAALWQRSVEVGADIVVMTDGDGEISPSQLFALAEAAEADGNCIIGSRVGRHEPLFRKLFSLVTRILIFLFSGRLAKDANSPYRALPREILVEITLAFGALSSLQMANLYQTLWLFLVKTPNYIDVKMRERIDGNREGVTWQSRTNFLPSRRLIRFAVSSLIESAANLPKVRRLAGPRR